MAFISSDLAVFCAKQCRYLIWEYRCTIDRKSKLSMFVSNKTQNKQNNLLTLTFEKFNE